jgi:3,4-dihydroxy 2-butanone 4-phosphate synthase/GTP cyclohydrolase II
VICEIMNEDGTMARMDDLVPFARQHGLKMGTIRDLIAYRMRYDHLVECVSEGPLISDYGGDWTAKSYRNKIDGQVHLVLQKGHVVPDVPTLVRMHSISIFADVLGQPGPRKRILQRAMDEVGKAGAGIIVILMQGGSERMTAEVGGRTERDMDLRAYGIGAQILADLGVQDMVLLTNSHRNIVAIEGYGLEIVGEQTIPGD